MSNIDNKVYNALSDIVFETGASKEEIGEAILKFICKFYEVDTETT